MQSKKSISSDRAGNRQGNNTAHEDYGHHITQDFHHDDCHVMIVASLSSRSRKFQATLPPEVFAKYHRLAFTNPTIVLDRILRQLPPPCLRGQPALTYSESILVLTPTPARISSALSAPSVVNFSNTSGRPSNRTPGSYLYCFRPRISWCGRC